MALLLWLLQLCPFWRSPTPPSDGPGLGDFADALFSDSLVSLFTQDAFERFYTAYTNGDITFVKHPCTRAWLIEIQGQSTPMSLGQWAKDIYPGLVQAEYQALLAQERQAV